MCGGGRMVRAVGRSSADRRGRGRVDSDKADFALLMRVAACPSFGSVFVWVLFEVDCRC